MIRSFASLIIGLITWTGVSLAGYQALWKAAPTAFFADGRTDITWVLVILLITYAIACLLSGLLSTWVHRQDSVRIAVWLALITQITALWFGIQEWAILPRWFVILAIILTSPLTIVGSDLAIRTANRRRPLGDQE